MPELPEVETVVRGLAPLLVGQRFKSVVSHRENLRLPLPPDLAQRLTGATVERMWRRAKYGLLATDRDDILLFHLGMSGKFRPLTPTEEAGKHDHIILEAGPHRLAYHDPRRFGLWLLLEAATAETHPLLAHIGPEPLSDSFSGAVLQAAAKGRKTSIKQLLLDQHVVAGIGNIYASEALFRARINPKTAAGRISAERLNRLALAVQEVLREAIAAGGSTLRDHAQVSGDLGYFQHRFAVYGREGQPCTACSKPLLRIVQAARSTFYCGSCQR